MKLFQKLINLLKLSKLMQTKSHLNGKTINLTSDNTIIKSTNFNVDKNGNMSCSNATVTGGKIELSGGTSESNSQFIIKNDDGRRTYMLPYFLAIKGSGTNQAISLQVGTQTNNLARTSLMVGYDNSNYMNMFATSSGTGIALNGSGGSTQINNNGITTPTLTQTSKEEMKKNFEPLNNALEIVKKTDIYKYNLKSEEDGAKKHIGFVIGDKYNYAEELTSINNDGADIYSLASVCLQAIKEQQEEIELLKQEIIKLKGEQ